jgi:hypothetical protein
MKKIKRSDLKGLTEMFPVHNEAIMKKVVGGYTDNGGTEWWWDWWDSVSGGTPSGYGSGGGSSSNGVQGWAFYDNLVPYL